MKPQFYSKRHSGDTQAQHRVFPAILVAIYFFGMISPPSFFPIDLRWYMVLGLGIFVFLTSHNVTRGKNYSFFYFFFGLGFIASLLSLFRVSDISNQLYLLVGWVIGMVSYYLMLPVLSQPITRKFLLLSLIFSAFAWSFHLQTQLLTSRYLISAYYLTGPGNDKNYIALIFSMAAVSLIAVAVLLEPTQIKNVWIQKTIKIGSTLTAAFFLYNLFFTYSRSGLIVCGIGLLSVLALFWIKRGGGIRSVIVIIFIGLFAYQVIPIILNLAPQWVGYFDIERVGVRVSLIQKTLDIIAGNPLLGIGINNTKPAYSNYSMEFALGLPHNLYLKIWAEQGILGFVAYISWILIFARKVYFEFWGLALIDQVWMVIIFVCFAMMMFLDMEALTLFLLAVYSGLISDDGIKNKP